jgi:signal transduction histidine kinase
LEILHEIDRSLLSAQSPNDITVGALARIRQLIPCPRASVTLFDLEKGEATFLAADFIGMETIPNTPIPLKEYGLDVIEKLQQIKPWITEERLNDSQASDLDRRLANEYGIHAWLSVPLHSQGRLIGGLNLGRGAGEFFTAEEAGIAHDVANQLVIALQQTNLYNALQNELAERKKLIAELEASNAELERFTYTVSHDLRNPLVTIKGFLGMLEKDIRERQSEKIQNDLGRIAGAADKMNELLSDLLELSRIGRILNPPEEINLVELAEDALESLEGKVRSRRVTVKISPDLPSVIGDRIRLREVLENLIDNSVKYMGEQTHPTIEIGMRNHQDEPILFVKDNGIGIEEQYQSKIFTLFEKLNPAIEGTGIGLALVKRIIETHNGRIWVESEGAGTGSTFCFTIPSSSQTPQSPPPAPKN